jgi:hypothetical protein
MKKVYTLFGPILLALMVFNTTLTQAQVTAGPSDITTAPPTNASDVGKVLCYGQNISISGPTETANTDYAAYRWYKLDANGNKQLTSITGRTYTETTTAAGYYNYQVVTENANGCSSPISDVFKIYVLPQLTVTVTSPLASMCAEATNATLLTANVTPTSGYTYTYQWTRNGVPIAGETSPTYNVTGETTAATVTFGVNVAYALNSSCTTTGTKDITITPLPTKPMITAN